MIMPLPITLNNPDDEGFAKLIYRLRRALDDFEEDSIGATLNGKAFWNLLESKPLNVAPSSLSKALDEVEGRL